MLTKLLRLFHQLFFQTTQSATGYNNIMTTYSKIKKLSRTSLNSMEKVINIIRPQNKIRVRAMGTQSGNTINFPNNLPTSKIAKSKVAISNGTAVRVVPFRLCKRTPPKKSENPTTKPLAKSNDQNQNQTENNNTPLRPPQQSSLVRQPRPRPRVSKKGSRPSRASRRLWNKHQQITQEYVNKQKSWCLRIGRTVELVDQTNNSWTNEKSKLLFMLSLGLTPKIDTDEGKVPCKSYSTISPLPVVKLTQVDPRLVAQVLMKTEINRLQNKLAQNKLLEHRRSSRERFRILDEEHNNNPYKSNYQLEVVDLVSDEE